MNSHVTFTDLNDDLFSLMEQNLKILQNNHLTALGIKHKTDKAATMKFLYLSSKEHVIDFGGHNYSLIYYELLKKYKDKKFNLLELGAGNTGASVKMWKEFFPNANITLFDPFFITHPDVTVTPEELEKLNINVVIGNQLCVDDLLKLVKHKEDKFDVIIDDASHVSDGVQISLATLLPYLDEDGFYFVEDLNSMRDRDCRISDVNEWLDGPDVNQNIKKIYHKEEIHILDSLISLKASARYKSKILSESQILYLQNNVKYFGCFRDFNAEKSLMLIMKKNLSNKHWLISPSHATTLGQRFVRTWLDPTMSTWVEQ